MLWRMIVKETFSGSFVGKVRPALRDQLASLRGGNLENGDWEGGNTSLPFCMVVLVLSALLQP